MVFQTNYFIQTNTTAGGRWTVINPTPGNTSTYTSNGLFTEVCPFCRKMVVEISGHLVKKHKVFRVHGEDGEPFYIPVKTKKEVEPDVVFESV